MTSRAPQGGPEGSAAIAQNAEESRAHSHEHGHDHGHEHDHDHGHDHDHDGPEAIKIPADRLTAEAKEAAEKETGKPIPDLPYSIAGEEKKPHSVLSLKFEVPAETMEQELDKYYNAVRKDVVLPGFRRGKAPIRLLRIRLGSDGDREALGEVALNTLRQEVLKRGLKLVADAQIVKHTVEAGKGATFEAELELEPTVELKEYKGLAVEVEEQPIPEAAVDQEIERLRANFATQDTAPAGAKVGPNDAIVIDLKVTGADGKEVSRFTRKDFLVADYKRNLPTEIAAEIEGKKAGATIEADVTHKQRTRKNEIKEFTDHWALTIKEIKVTKLPEADDEFAKDLGEHDTIAALRDAIRKDLEAREAERFRRAGIGKILDAMIEKNPVDAPRSMVSAQQYMSMMQDSYELSRVGLKLKDVVRDPAGYFSASHVGADAAVRRSLLCRALAEAEKLQAGDEDVEKEIERMAEQAGRKALAIRANLEAEGKLDDLKENLVNRKIEDFLLANNTVKKVAPKPPEKTEEAPEAEAKPKAKGKAKAEEAPKAEKEAAADEPEAKKAAKPKKKAAPKSK